MYNKARCYFTCAERGLCVEWGSYSHGNAAGLYSPPRLSDCRCTARRTWAGGDQWLRPRDLHVYLRLSAGKTADRCHADHPRGGHLRGLPADFGRSHRHAEVCGEVPAQQSEARHDSRAADDVVSDGALRYGARRLYDVPDHLRYCHQAGHSSRASDGRLVRGVADGHLRIAGLGRCRLDGGVPLGIGA